MTGRISTASSSASSASPGTSVSPRITSTDSRLRSRRSSSATTADRARRPRAHGAGCAAAPSRAHQATARATTGRVAPARSVMTMVSPGRSSSLTTTGSCSRRATLRISLAQPASTTATDSPPAGASQDAPCRHRGAAEHGHAGRSIRQHRGRISTTVVFFLPLRRPSRNTTAHDGHGDDGPSWPCAYGRLTADCRRRRPATRGSWPRCRHG